MKAKELANKYKTLLNTHGINTPKRLAMFFAQLDHESGLKPISENLNYSASRLLQVFPKYFNKYNVMQYDRKPEKIANRVYSNRMGNGNELSGDGWKYRGRGFIQITGKYNYQLFSAFSGLNVVSNPDLLLEEANALYSAIWFWVANKINNYADNGDVVKATKAINGGLNGLADRVSKYDKYLKEFQ